MFGVLINKLGTYVVLVKNVLAGKNKCWTSIWLHKLNRETVFHLYTNGNYLADETIWSWRCVASYGKCFNKKTSNHSCTIRWRWRRKHPKNTDELLAIYIGNYYFERRKDCRWILDNWKVYLCKRPMVAALVKSKILQLVQ